MAIHGDDYVIRFDPASQHVVGDRLIPSPIEVGLHSGGDTPWFQGRIEVVGGVPRWTEVALHREGEGEEIRKKHLDAIRLDDWIEWAVSLAATRIREGVAAFPPSQDESAQARRAVQSLRVGSRRTLTDARLKKVAAVYNAAEMYGLNDVEKVIGVSRATAARLVKAARDKGFITTKGSSK